MASPVALLLLLSLHSFRSYNKKDKGYHDKKKILTLARDTICDVQRKFKDSYKDIKQQKKTVTNIVKNKKVQLLAKNLDLIRVESQKGKLDFSQYE